MTGGYFKLARQFKKHHLWTERREFSRFEAWLDLLTEARFQDGVEQHEGMIYRVQRGQLAASVRGLSRRWGWSWKKTSRFLEALERDQMIGRNKVGMKVDMISIINYKRFQGSGNAEWTQSGRTLFKKEKRKISPEGENRKAGPVRVNLLVIDCPICRERHPLGNCSIKQEIEVSDEK